LSDPFPPPETLDAQLQEQLAAALPEPLWEKLNGSLQRDQRRLRSTEERLHLAEYKVRLLEERLRLIRLNKYGPGSEKLSDAQLELLEAEPGVSIAEVAAESHREPLAPRPAKPSARPHPGRQQLPAHLPRVERLIACTPEQCICGQCGRPTTFIGYEQSEQLEVEPAKYVVVVTKREKRACQACEDQGVACAPLPARIIEKGLASDRVVIDTVVRKYSDHRAPRAADEEMCLVRCATAQPMREEKAPRDRLTGAGPKSPSAAVVKSHGREHRRKRSGIGSDQMGNREMNESEPLRTCRNVYQTRSKPGGSGCPGISMDETCFGPCGLRHEGGMTLLRGGSVERGNLPHRW
jgi:transposase